MIKNSTESTNSKKIYEEKRQQIEEQISKENHFTETLINSLPGIFYFFDEKGKFLRWNENFEQITGYSSEEISRLHPLDLFIGDEKNFIEERIKEVFVKGESFAEANLISKDGKSTPYYFTGKKIQIEDEICLLGMGIDITERKIAEREMYKLATIVEHSDSAIISKNLDGTILSWNKGAEKIFGYTEEEILDKNIRLLIPPEYQNEEEEIIDRIKKSETINHYETVRVKKDGTRFPILLTVSAIKDKTGQIIGVSKIATDISERIRAEIALQESESRYRELFENNPFPMWVYDLDTLKFLAVNDAAEFYYGYKKAEFLSMTIMDIRPPGEIPSLLENLGKNSEKIEKSGPWKHLKKDGSLIDVEISSHQINFDGKVARLVLSNDVTERKRAEENLIESQRQMRELAESLPQLVWTCRGDGFCDYLSPQWVNYTGIPENEQLGYKWLEQIHPEDRENTNAAWEKTVNKGFTFDVEFRIRRFDGVYRWFKTRAVPYKNAENEITRWFGTNTDIEESKQAEKNILLLNDTLETRVAERTAELEAANRELESFSYSVSHDLRAPLRAIDGFSRALLEDYSNILDDEGKLYLNRVRAASQQMARLIEDLLTLSRVTRREINRTKVDLSKIAFEIVEILKERNEDRVVEFQIESGIDANGDEGLLRIVMENLLENSWKFTSKNEKAEIFFGQKYINGKFYYFVKDNGAGFDMKYADKLFGAFQRLHTTQEFAGTGIGLATVNRILLRHGGSIFAEGKISEGATFYFKI